MKKKLTDILYSISLLLFITAFGFQHNPPSGWYQQFMPDLGKPLTDITFTDSLTGYAIQSTGSSSDTNYILKTSDGGDNWSVNHVENKILRRIIFLNNDTGYVAAHEGTLGHVLRTTNGGTLWSALSILEHVTILDMHILNNDTMWIACRRIPNYEILRTTNGGTLWTIQLQQTSPIFDKIYMYDGNLGFVGNSTTNYLLRTSNSGINWDQVQGQDGFRDIYFTNMLTGWKSSPFGMKKTTDSGLTWILQTLQSGGYIQESFIYNFANINSDTIWGTGGFVLFPNNQFRAILHRTTNGGNNWHYQIPDTSMQISSLGFINFTNSNYGWAYRSSPTGIHTKSGGDSLFLSIRKISSEFPETFSLHQNYPNPFNPVTKIKFDVFRTGDVKLIVYDVLGRIVSTLVNEPLSAGSYEYTFDARLYGQGSGLPSGVYFYSLSTEEITITKKMLLSK